MIRLLNFQYHRDAPMYRIGEILAFKAETQAGAGV